MLLIQAVVVGVIATLVMDVLGGVRGKYFAVKSLNYAWVGRWALGWKDCQFKHRNIMQAPARRGEMAVGWLLHYVTGILWAYLLLLSVPNWLAEITFWPALLTGLLSLAFPFLMMQPAFGFGFFAAKTPAPRLAIQNSLIAHLCFAVGLYIAAWIYNALFVG